MPSVAESDFFGSKRKPLDTKASKSSPLKHNTTESVVDK